MARIDSFLKKWASVPSQFERPSDALIDRGWAGGAAEDPPEAKWENWWHNRVDEALAEIESNGAMQWFADVSYAVGASTRDDGKNWIAALPSNGVKPGSVDDIGHWLEIGANASETLRGVLRVGTQAEVDAGVLDDVAVTPKKLRWGFTISKGANGYIAFPAWLGGLIIQWANGLTAANGTLQLAFPITFPNACLSLLASDRNAQTFGTMDTSGMHIISCQIQSNSLANIYTLASGGVTPVASAFFIMAIGH